MAGTKILKLLQLLIQRRLGVTKQELASILERSPRQVERYLNDLRDAGLPLVSDNEDNDGVAHRWRIDREGFLGLPHETPPLGLGFPEMFTVTAALECALLPHCDWIDKARRSAIEKLCVYLPGPDGRRMPLYRAGVVAIGPDEARLEQIHQSVIEHFINGAVCHRVVSLHYPWGGKSERSKKIEPLGVGLIYGGLYGVACIQPYHEPRWLNLSRAVRARICDEEFDPPADFDLNAFMRANFGMWQDAGCDVRVRFSAEAAPAIRAREIHPTQRLEEQADGSVVLGLHIGGKREFLWWLLGWGASAELLEPEDWREEMAAEIKKMDQFYTQ